MNFLRVSRYAHSRGGCNVGTKNLMITNNSISKRSSSILSSSASNLTNNDYNNDTMATMKAFTWKNQKCQSQTVLMIPLQQQNHQNYQHQQIRMKRKGAKMGKHLETLEEMAHREEHEKAKEKRKYKKGKGKGKNNRNNDDDDNSSNMSVSSSNNNEIPTLQEDENETVFDNSKEDNEDLIPSLPSKEEVKTRMMKVVTAMEESFKSIRGAEATPELFDNVQVKAYGSLTPLNGVGQVVINTPTMATITCFDPDVGPAVRDAVRDMSGMNFNPRIDEDGVVLVPIPRVSAETRKVWFQSISLFIMINEKALFMKMSHKSFSPNSKNYTFTKALVKQLGKTAENTRQRIRRIRRGAQDVVKKAKDGKLEGISEDDAFRAGKDIDAVTEECIKSLNVIVEKKQASVMSV